MKQTQSKKKFYTGLHWRHKEPREKFREDVPICKAFGCCKVLTPEELFFNPDYCFTHARERKNK